MRVSVVGAGKTGAGVLRQSRLRKLMATVVAIGLLSLLGPAQAQAQEETPKLELGLQFAMLGLDGVKPVLPDATEPGFGGRVTWNLNHRYSVESEACFIFQVTVQNQTQPRGARGARGRRWDADALNLSFNSSFPRVPRAPRGSSVQPWLAITVIYFLRFMKLAESEVNFFPKDRLERGRGTQALFGMKMSARVENAGVFLKIRPGLIHFDQAVTTPTLVGRGSFNSTNFALDLGGGLEFYPSRHTMVRFDFGDTIIRLSGINCPFPGCSRNDISNNFQFNAGIGWRF